MSMTDENLMDLFDVPADMVEEARKGREPFHLNVPETAKYGKKNKKRAYFTEAGTIVSAIREVITETNSGRTHVGFQIGFQIGAEGSGENVGKVLKRTFRICPAALREDKPAEGQKPSGEYMMSRMSTTVLIQLLEAKGITAVDEETGLLKGETLAWAFPVEGGDPSPLIDDTVVMFEVSQEPEWKTSDAEKNGAPPDSYKVEIERIYALEG